MPQWAGSSWYYLRYIDPHNTEKLADEDLLKQWLPVDIYVGGAEHAVLHLLYARFWHKFLYDLGVVPTKEPFQKLFNQGMILGTSYRDHRGALVATDKVEKRDGSFFHVETGEELEQAPAKMSKSLKNVVNPDDVVEQYGADTLRVYETFMGPLDASIAWSEEGLEGSRKFLDRVYRLITTKEIVAENNGALDKVYNETVKAVTEQIESMKFNTAIAQLMVFVNAANKEDKLLCRLRQRLYPIDRSICASLGRRTLANSHSNRRVYLLCGLANMGRKVNWLKTKSKSSFKSKVKSVPNSWSQKTFHAKNCKKSLWLTTKSKQRLMAKKL